MSRTNENKLKMKDIATIGIFSALLFVVTMVAGALMGISMVLNMYSVAVVAVLSAPLYMLIMAKVHKKGAVLYAGSENAFYIMQNMNCGFYPFL